MTNKNILETIFNRLIKTGNRLKHIGDDEFIFENDEQCFAFTQTEIVEFSTKANQPVIFLFCE